MKKFILMCICALTLGLTCQAQEVVKKGNTFKVQRDSVSNRQSQETKTNYEYEDAKGNTYDIYLSGTGKAFIKKVSKKTGKTYRQYLPQVGKQINPKAYETKKT